MKLNIGCGADYREGYLNIDVRPEIRTIHGETVKPDMITDIAQKDGMLFPANSIQTIFAKDIIEHFPRSVARKLLKSWAEMLEPHGELTLIFPDVEACVEDAQAGKWSWKSALERIYGGQDYEFNFHYCGFCPETITEILGKLYLDIIEITKLNCNLKVVARKR
jgi:predicted SAM-dependent methyltransferase